MQLQQNGQWKNNMKPFSDLQEDLRKWFSKTDPAGDWKRINSKGEAIGPCAREPGEPKPKCMSAEKRASLTKKERASAVRAKRKNDPNPERKGKPINVSNFGKGKISESMKNLNEKNVPTSPEKWAQAKSQAKAKFDVYPSAYANGWAAKKYKAMGGSWKSVSEAKEKTEYDYEGDMARGQLQSIISNAQRVHDMLKDDTNIAEWVQSKITLAEDYISTVANYMMSELDESSSARLRLANAMKRAQEQREREERAGAALLKPKPKNEEVEQQNEAMSHQAATTMKHISNASPALKKAAKDIKPGVGGYRDRIAMLKAGGVKEEVELDEVKMADLPSTKVQGRSYGSSKPEPSAFDVLKGPKDKELKSIESEKKKKKMSEMVALYKDGGMKAFFESIKKEDFISEEPDSEQFAKELEDQKKRAAGTKPQADVAKPSVQSVKQEEVEIQVINADLANGVDQVDIEERVMTEPEKEKKEEMVKSMKKGLAGFKERYGDRAKNVMYATATKNAMKD